MIYELREAVILILGAASIVAILWAVVSVEIKITKLENGGKFRWFYP